MMKPLDKITVRLTPARQPGLTQLRLSGLISTRLSHKDVRRLWQLIDGFAEQVSVALPVDAPLPWFDLWTLRTGYAPGNRLSIHFFRSHRGVYLAGREV